VQRDDDLDGLFQLPLTEFTGARNALAARLKKDGRREEAEQVKALGKPSISAWAVNQLYWKHRDEFDVLIKAGERVRSAHTSQLAGKTADMRGSLAARRESLSHLARLADALLREAGHSPTPDTMRRITTTLEALSTFSSLPDTQRPGRLSDDLDPPGFDSMAALIPSVKQEPPAREAKPAKPAPAAKAALRAAEQTLRKAQAKAEDASAELKKATSQAGEAEKERRLAEQRLARASIAAEEARERVKNLSAETEKAERLLHEAEAAVEEARKGLTGLRDG
jgi:hypothetical protein